MQDLGHSKAVIAIIGDAYLKSENCMFELVEIAAKGDFKDRIFPIILPSAQIDKPAKRAFYIRYWEQQIAELEEELKTLSSANLSSLQSNLTLYTDIRRTLDGIMNTLQDLITVKLETIDDLDTNPEFSQLLQQLQDRLTP
jgi:hypothetical protein